MLVLLAVKSVIQPCHCEQLMSLMETFRQMVNECIKIGLEHDASTLKKLSKLSYSLLSEYDVISYYKLCAISHATGILANRKKSLNRGLKPRNPYAKQGLLISCYGFKIIDGVLMVSLGNRQYFDIPLNNYVRKILSDPSLQVRSFTLTANNTVSICYSKEVAKIECNTIVGVDRNLRNLTVGNQENVAQYDLSKAVDVAENTRSIVRSFKRNDVRSGKRLWANMANVERIESISSCIMFPSR